MSRAVHIKQRFAASGRHPRIDFNPPLCPRNGVCPPIKLHASVRKRQDHLPLAGPKILRGDWTTRNKRRNRGFPKKSDQFCEEWRRFVLCSHSAVTVWMTTLD
jgi:hypothetical protein